MVARRVKDFCEFPTADKISLRPACNHRHASMRGVALSGLHLTACVQGRTPLIKGAFDVTQIIARQ
jgi:hypothetical protein